MNLCLLVHSFDGYKHLWPGLVDSYRKHWTGDKVDMYFGTDLPTDEDLSPFKIIYSGTGEWSNRLISLISQLDYDYILYTQEDQYPRRPIPIGNLFCIANLNDLLRMQISPVNHFYTLTGNNIPLHFHQTSKYLVSHQPSIWRKEFLLSCLKPGESPWQNEYKATLRLQESPEKIQNRIAIYPIDWYNHMCVKGNVQEK